MNFGQMIARIKAGDPLSASMLFNPLIDAANFRNDRELLRGVDVWEWLPCIMPTQDVPAYSILGVEDVEVNANGLQLVLALPDVSHEVFVGNEHYPLYAAFPGWCKLINETYPVRVRCLDEVNFLDELVIDPWPGGPAVALPSGGTGTPSGSGGITPACSLWVFSPRLDAGGTGTGTGTGTGINELYQTCGVMGRRLPFSQLFQSAEPTINHGPLGFGNAVQTFQAWRVNPETQEIDQSRTYAVDTSFIGSNIVFAGGPEPPLGGVGPATEYCFWAVLFNGVYYAVNGGTCSFEGEVTGFVSGSTYLVAPTLYNGDDVSCKSLFSEPLTAGQSVFVVMRGAQPTITNVGCVVNTGTGT